MSFLYKSVLNSIDWHRCLALRGLLWLKGRHGRLVMLDSTNKTIGLRKRSEEMPGAYTSIWSPWASRPLWPQEVVHALLAVVGEAAQVLAVHAHAAPAHRRSSQGLVSTAHLAWAICGTECWCTSCGPGRLQSTAKKLRSKIHIIQSIKYKCTTWNLQSRMMYNMMHKT